MEEHRAAKTVDLPATKEGIQYVCLMLRRISQANVEMGAKSLAILNQHEDLKFDSDEQFSTADAKRAFQAVYSIVVCMQGCIEVASEEKQNQEWAAYFEDDAPPYSPPMHMLMKLVMKLQRAAFLSWYVVVFHRVDYS